MADRLAEFWRSFGELWGVVNPHTQSKVFLNCCAHAFTIVDKSVPITLEAHFEGCPSGLTTKVLRTLPF
jgi:hypothetical protein